MIAILSAPFVDVMRTILMGRYIRNRYGRVQRDRSWDVKGGTP